VSHLFTHDQFGLLMMKEMSRKQLVDQKKWSAFCADITLKLPFWGASDIFFETEHKFCSL
jgi:hypothetical protein